MSESTYLTLPDDVGVAPQFIVNDKGLTVPNPKAGDPEPLISVGINIPVPTMVGKDVVNVAHRAEIKPGSKLDETLRARIVPDSRIIETDHPAVVNVLTGSGYVQCDPPGKTPSKQDKEA